MNTVSDGPEEILEAKVTQLARQATLIKITLELKLVVLFQTILARALTDKTFVSRVRISDLLIYASYFLFLLNSIDI